MSSRRGISTLSSSSFHKFIYFCLIICMIAIFSAAPNLQAQSKGFLELTNQTSLKVVEISPVAEYFKTEKVAGKASNVGKAYIYKTGYKIKINNQYKKDATIKIEMILDYLAEGNVFSYITYDVIDAKHSKDVLLMCDNIPVECINDGKEKDQSGKCRELALSTWDRHVKKVVISQLK